MNATGSPVRRAARAPATWWGCAVTWFPVVVAVGAAACAHGSGPEGVAPAPMAAPPPACASAANGVSPGPLGIGLVRAVSEDGSRNALVSPLGAGTVLAMAAQGASRPVRTAIGALLGPGGASSQTDPLSAGGVDAAAAPAGGADDFDCRLAAIRAAAHADSAVRLRVANAVFADQALDVYPAFAAALEARFGARFQSLAFSDSRTPELINAWVREATRGAVPRLLGRLESDDALVLVNAVAFEGLWSHAFDPARTAPLPFRQADGGVVEVPAMHADGLPARYREDAGLQAVVLPYGDGAFDLTVVLPAPGRNASETLARLAAEPAWLGGAGFRRSVGTLTLPRVTLAGEASLVPALGALGLRRALAEPASFAGVAAPAPLLGRVIQRTRLVLDEQGTTAAAATAGVMATRAAVPEQDSFAMRVDRPFALGLRHRATGTLLFAGWIASPDAR